MIIVGCSLCGWLRAQIYLRDEDMLRQMQQVLRFMIHDLKCRRRPLPALFRGCGEQGSGILQEIFLDAALEMENQILPDAAACMRSVLNRYALPDGCKEVMDGISRTLGHFDLEGQVRELESVLFTCGEMLKEHCAGKADKIRTIRTLGISAGIVLAILLL